MRIPGPRSWPGRLLLAGVLVEVAGVVMVHFPAARVPGRVIQDTVPWILTSLLLAWAAAGTSKALRRKPDGPPDLEPLAWMYGVLVGIAPLALVFLVSQGNPAALGARSAHVNSSGLLPGLESFVMVEGLLYALLFGPETIRRKLPINRASDQAQRLVPAGLAAGAAAVTGSYLLALHFFDEPLARAPLGPLVASIVAVMALLTPFYQLIARACWRYSLADLLDPAKWWEKWLEVRAEIRNATGSASLLWRIVPRRTTRAQRRPS